MSDTYPVNVKRMKEENHPYEDEILKEYEEEYEDPREYRREMKKLSRTLGTKGLKKKER